MNNDQAKELCLRLIHADTEEEVISILDTVGYWSDLSVWRHYGDYENNYNTIGNQQGSPDAALVEKIVNSVDARLTNECLIRGIDPTSDNAPKSIKEAVILFFEPEDSKAGGRLKEWSNSKRRDEARFITLSATGQRANQGNPSFTISDQGEGQTPLLMPQTFLSLTKSNKQSIYFVQGKFNMGGTGALAFCGNEKLQLIVSRRNPILVGPNLLDPSDLDWGFTLVRRIRPEHGRRSSMYVYLAPIGAEKAPMKGDVLHFHSDKLPIFPNQNEPYVRDSEWGTLIKLYEYSGFKSHIFRKDGLLQRIDLLIPEIALPIRFHECRSGFKGEKERSFETSMNGLSVRLEEGKIDNLENEIPWSFQMNVEGEQMYGTIYVFKTKEIADTYRKKEGVIFSVNGQTHGSFTIDFFRNKSSGKYSYLADSMLIVVDCSSLSEKAIEDLFMNSRDRLSNSEFRKKVESQLAHELRHHEGLRELQAHRRMMSIEAALNDSKPLEKVLESILMNSPALSSLFIKGERISTPFKSKKVQQKKADYMGKRFPTYFRFKHKDYGLELYKECHINMRSRITFETDAVNDYFTRDFDKGVSYLYLFKKGKWIEVLSGWSINTVNGVATLSLTLPDKAKVGDEFYLKLIVDDSTRVFPFENHMHIKVVKESPVKSGSNKRHEPPHDNPGKDRDKPSGISLPTIKPIYQTDWDKQSPPFDKYTALRVVPGGEIIESEQPDTYDFYINMDNVFLVNEMKNTKKDVRLYKARFETALVLCGIALLQKDTQKDTAEIDEAAATYDASEYRVEDRIEDVTRALAPIILPMIDTLGDLDEDHLNGIY